MAGDMLEGEKARRLAEDTGRSMKANSRPEVWLEAKDTLASHSFGEGAKPIQESGTIIFVAQSGWGQLFLQVPVSELPPQAATELAALMKRFPEGATSTMLLRRAHDAEENGISIANKSTDSNWDFRFGADRTRREDYSNLLTYLRERAKKEHGDTIPSTPDITAVRRRLHI